MLWNSFSSEIVIDNLVRNLLSVAGDGILPNTSKPQQYLRIWLVFNLYDKSINVGIRSTCIAINALSNALIGYPFGPHVVCGLLNSSMILVENLKVLQRKINILVEYT